MRGRAGFAATVFGQRIYIAGGWNNSGTLKTVMSSDSEVKEWREEPPMNLPRKYLTLATIRKEEGKDDHIVALRGTLKFGGEVRAARAQVEAAHLQPDIARRANGQHLVLLYCYLNVL
ncbi:hypothetical protein WR25_14172 [Diploscapter pachys]|uniref:Uncharacterized protein n=1 Tax=Diploscapter pachys TaxID=2018661 RepID=A0A2A2LKR8_9BILA|nr:hypothetical protein WR25_14172 [Diploscapter pachys]